mmetsp:Transcript_1182/g.4340  ORF Transcript_1182/g.4340 Transcript_1182/m.4340 type:complete len:381 (+) Transcript_1182:4275-5417(+)
MNWYASGSRLCNDSINSHSDTNSETSKVVFLAKTTLRKLLFPDAFSVRSIASSSSSSSSSLSRGESSSGSSCKVTPVFSSFSISLSSLFLLTRFSKTSNMDSSALIPLLLPMFFKALRNRSALPIGASANASSSNEVPNKSFISSSSFSPKAFIFSIVPLTTFCHVSSSGETLLLELFVDGVLVVVVVAAVFTSFALAFNDASMDSKHFKHFFTASSNVFAQLPSFTIPLSSQEMFTPTSPHDILSDTSTIGMNTYLEPKHSHLLLSTSAATECEIKLGSNRPAPNAFTFFDTFKNSLTARKRLLVNNESSSSIPFDEGIVEVHKQLAPIAAIAPLVSFANSSFTSLPSSLPPPPPLFISSSSSRFSCRTGFGGGDLGEK